MSTREKTGYAFKITGHYCRFTLLSSNPFTWKTGSTMGRTSQGGVAIKNIEENFWPSVNLVPDIYIFPFLAEEAIHEVERIIKASW